MKRHAVVSSAIRAIGHDPQARKLHLEFSDGKVAEYDGVSAEQHAALMAAESKGRHFHEQLRGKDAHPWRYV
jgi:predicted RecB family endonuclease